MSSDEERLNLRPMTEDHEVISAWDDVVDLLPCDGKERVFVPMNLNDVAMDGGTFPSGSPPARPPDELRISHAEQGQRHAACAA